MRISDWSSDVCSSDLEIGFQREFRAGIGLWRAAAAGVGCAQAHPGGLDAGDMLRTLKSERGGEPDEFHAFLFGIGDFTLRARHVFPVAAIEALDRLRPLPDRRANAVHRSVAAADHDDILVLGVQAAVLKLGHGIAKADAVGGSQIIECLHYAARADAGRLDVAGLVDASGDRKSTRLNSSH